MIRRLGCERGAAAMEFALLAPLLFGVMFMIIEGCRMIWTQQVIQEAAFASVRCMALGSAGCTSTTEVQSWAVSIAAPYSKLVNSVIPAVPATLNAAVCFPPIA